MAGNQFSSAQAPGYIQAFAPDLAAQQTQLSRQQQLADMLRQQGAAPMGDTQVIGGWAVRRNPLEAVSKMAQALMGGYMQNDADEKQIALGRAMQQRMTDLAYRMAGGGSKAPGAAPTGAPPAGTPPVVPTPTAPDPDPANAALSQGSQQQPSTPDATGTLVNRGGVGPTVQNAARMDAIARAVANAPATVPAAPGAPLPTQQRMPPAAPEQAPTPLQMTQIDSIRTQAVAAYLAGNTDLFNKLIENISTLTNEQKNWSAQGIDPRQLAAGTIAESNAKGKTPDIVNAEYMGKTPAQMLAASLAADGKNGEIERKPGTQFKNFYTGDSGMVPVIPDYANPVGEIASNGALPGGVAPIKGAQAIATSNAGAVKKAEQSNTIITNVSGENGKPQSGFGGDMFGGSPTPASVAPKVDLNHMTPTQSKQFMTLAEKQFGLREGATPGTHVMEGADPTVQTARNNQQNNMADKWKPLNDAVTNAQTVNSRLDTIKDLATRATTGQFADKLQFVNSLLSLAGSEKATDANTAKALLDKNSNQIVAQLGSGGMGTDAARQIIAQAYPNSHMSAPAIAEASDNLKAANNMLVAKAKVLQQHYLNNDPAAYQKAESAFNEAADPRIYQWKAMSGDPKAQAAYAAKLMKQDPNIANRIRVLEGMGAL